jgi:two-component system, response regulator PdtaR
MPDKSILIVEDEAIVAMTIEDTLHEMGYSVVGQAANAEDALRLARDKKPDLILMDIHIQGDRDGIITAEEINTRYGIPIIYLTAYSDDETIQRAAKTRPYGFLTKPFRKNEMYSTIEMALYKHRIIQQEENLEPAESIERSSAATIAPDGYEKVLLDRIGIPIFVLSRDMRLVYYNKPLETFFDKTGCLDPRLRRSVFEIAPPSIIGYPKDYRIVFETNHTNHIEKMIMVDGSNVSIRLVIISMPGRDELSDNVAVVIKDISRERAITRRVGEMYEHYENLLTKIGGIMRISKKKEDPDMREINMLLNEIVITLAKMDPKHLRNS